MPSIMPLHFHGWFNGLVSFSICLLGLIVVHKLAERWRLHDSPGELKIHTTPTPRLGGIAMGLAILIGISIGGTSLFSRAGDVYLALVIIWITGLIDDLRGLSPEIRLTAQFIAGLVIAQTQWRLTITGNPILDALATCLFVVVFVNAFNFFDGADGLAGGVAAIVALGYVLLYTAREPSVGAAVSWSLLGSCVAFLILNFPPARIFMGDSGSTLLGLVVAFLGLDFYRAHHAIGTHIVLPIVFAGLPLMDFLLAVLRRLKNGRSPFAGDRQHFYDLLMQQGWSARPVALGAYGITGTFVLGGWLCYQVSWLYATLILTVVFGYMFVAAIRLGALR